jgi:hypothetical protein
MATGARALIESMAAVAGLGRLNADLVAWAQRAAASARRPPPSYACPMGDWPC